MGQYFVPFLRPSSLPLCVEDGFVLRVSGAEGSRLAGLEAGLGRGRWEKRELGPWPPTTPRAVPSCGRDSSEPPLLRGTGQEGAALASLPELRFHSAPEDVVAVNYSQPLIIRRGSPLKCGAARVEAREGTPFGERAVYFRVNFE